VHDTLNASASLPPGPHDAPLTVSGDQAHSSVALVRLAWLGNQEGEPSCPRLRGECATLNLQQCNPNKPTTRCNTAQRAGHKSAKELLSLSFSFLMQSFILFESMPIGQNCHDIAGLLAVGGYPDYVSIHLTSTKNCSFFLFSKSFDARNDCAPRTTKVLEVAALGRTKKH
jgi:hypothetical protein